MTMTIGIVTAEVMTMTIGVVTVEVVTRAKEVPMSSWLAALERNTAWEEQSMTAQPHQSIFRLVKKGR